MTSSSSSSISISTSSSSSSVSVSSSSSSVSTSTSSSSISSSSSSSSSSESSSSSYSESTSSISISSSSSSVSHTGLIPGSTYYYSLWGESGGDYSSSPISIVMTTLSNNYSNTGLLPLDDPTNKDIQNPDTTVLSKLGPFYSLINNFINSWGFTNGVGWAGLFAFLIVIIGLIVYVRSASISMALVVIVVCMVIGYFLHIFSWWWILFGALGMLGSFALPKREV